MPTNIINCTLRYLIVTALFPVSANCSVLRVTGFCPVVASREDICVSFVFSMYVRTQQVVQRFGTGFPLGGNKKKHQHVYVHEQTDCKPAHTRVGVFDVNVHRNVVVPVDCNVHEHVQSCDLQCVERCDVVLSDMSKKKHQHMYVHEQTTVRPCTYTCWCFRIYK